MGLPGCLALRSEVPEALVAPAPRGQTERDCRKVRHLPWRAVETCEVAIGIDVASRAQSGAPTAEAAAVDPMAAVVLV